MNWGSISCKNKKINRIKKGDTKVEWGQWNKMDIGEYYAVAIFGLKNKRV